MAKHVNEKIKTFQAPATLDGVSPLKDGGMSIRFHTNELTKEDKVTIMEFYQAFGFVLFKENEFMSTDVPKEQAPESGKSPSQRLRGVMYAYHIKSNKPKDEFERWRRGYIESVIDHFKEKINDLEK